MDTKAGWRPTASHDALKLRATVLARIRSFFESRDVLEVDTPALSYAASTDPALISFETTYSGPGAAHRERCYLHTSPEFPMKRMLAAGSGSIYQLCKVFRDGERGARHNPEFTLLEWYRVGLDHLDLMDEVEQLVTAVLSGILPISSVRHWSYRELFVEMAGIDPFTAETQALAAVLDADIGFAVVGLTGADRDAWLDLIMTHIIEPRLGDGLVFIRDYPASQAALARVRPGDPQVASRFEVYLNGMELANGFHELSDATEQAQRFEQELARRREAGIVTVDIDDHLLAALQAGLPDCAGVALGVDRLLMCACGAQHIQDVIAFPFEVA